MAIEPPHDPPIITSMPGVLAFRWASELFEIEGGCRPGDEVLAIDAGAVLMVPLCESNLEKRSDFLEAKALWQSAEQAGHYYIVNCSCGIASCGRVEGGIRVTHPDAATIVWDIEVENMRGMFPRSAPSGGLCGILRLVFSRERYESDIREMVRAMQARATQPLRWDDIGHLGIGGETAIHKFRTSHPHLESLRIVEWLPDDSGDELLAMDPDAPFVVGPPPPEDERPRAPLS